MAPQDSSLRCAFGPSCPISGPMLELETERLRLVAATGSLAKAALEDHQRLASLLSAQPDPEWPTDIIRDTITFFVDTLTARPELAGWLLWFVILKDEARGDHVIGSISFAGQPDEEGCARLGVSVVPGRRGNDYATEALEAMMNRAFERGVRSCWCKVAKDNASAIRVFEKAGMSYSGEEGSQVMYKLDNPA